MGEPSEALPAVSNGEIGGILVVVMLGWFVCPMVTTRKAYALEKTLCAF